MTSLLIAIALNSLIFVLFRLFVNFKVNTFQAIVVNYVVCAITSIYFLEDINHIVMINLNLVWVQIAIILGALFIFTFYMMGFTTQACGLTVASVATKMSLIIPVFFSIYVFVKWKTLFTNLQYIGIVIAVIAVLFTSVKGKKTFAVKIPNVYAIILPVLVFCFGGAIDTLINYSKFFILSVEQDNLFMCLIFIVAGLTGIIILTILFFTAKQSLDIKSIAMGVVLGVPNYFSIFYLVKTITEFKNNGALVYPLINMGIIVLSSLISVIAFKEKLSKINVVGIALALISLILIAHKEFLVFLK